MINDSISKMLRQKLKLFAYLSMLIALISLPFILVTILYPNIINAAISGLENHAWYFRLLRWSVMLIFIVFWPYLIEIMGKMANMPIELMTRWKSERARIVIWLLLFELLISENIIFKLIYSRFQS